MKRSTLERAVLAENLAAEFYNYDKPWFELSEKEKGNWICCADFVLDREAMLTTVVYHRRAVKRQIGRIKERLGYEES